MAILSFKELQRCEGDERTALHWAAESGHTDVVKLLLEAGADKDVATRYGRAALHFAADESHAVSSSVVVKLLPMMNR